MKEGTNEEKKRNNIANNKLEVHIDVTLFFFVNNNNGNLKTTIG